MRDHAYRRHHEWRLKHRVPSYYGGVFRNEPRQIGKLARTPTPCSCWMCGNPRKYLRELTMQERRNES